MKNLFKVPSDPQSRFYLPMIGPCHQLHLSLMPFVITVCNLSSYPCTCLFNGYLPRVTYRCLGAETASVWLTLVLIANTKPDGCADDFVCSLSVPPIFENESISSRK